MAPGDKSGCVRCRVPGSAMPFPFLPAGLLLAVAVLGGAFAIFALALRLIGRAAITARDSIAPGIVAGLRTWSQPRQSRPDPASFADVVDLPQPPDDLPQPPEDVRLQPVRGSISRGR